MRAILFFCTLAFVGLVQPAAAQTCGPGSQEQTSTPSRGMMCGMMGQAASDDPMADKATPKSQQAGMCPCCRNMAMMGGMMGGGMMGSQPGSQPQHMPGMQMPRPQ